MHPDASQLRVKPGEPVLPAWKRLLAWVRAKEVIRGGSDRTRFRETPEGTEIIVEGAGSWPLFFRVSPAGNRAVSVEPGSVNGTMARIGNRYLDGRRIDDPTRQAEPPTLSLVGVKPDAEGRTFVVVDVLPAEEAEGEEAGERLPEVRHVDEASGSQQILAVLYWDAAGSRIRRVGQNVMHNLNHQLREERHFFWAI